MKTACSNNDIPDLKVKLLKLEEKEDTLFVAYNNLRNQLSSSDSLIQNDKKFVKDMLSFYNNSWISSISRTILNTTVFQSLYNNKIDADSINQQIENVKETMNHFSDTLKTVVTKSAGSVSNAYVSMKSTFITPELPKANSPFKISAYIKNFGGSNADSITVTLKTPQEISITSKPEVFISSLNSQKEILLEWDVSVSETSYYAGTYTISISSPRTENQFSEIFYLDAKLKAVGVKGDETENPEELEISVIPNPLDGSAVVKIDVLKDSFTAINLSYIIHKQSQPSQNWIKTKDINPYVNTKNGI